MVVYPLRRTRAMVLATLAGFVVAGAAVAQTDGASVASTNAAYARANLPADAQVRDAKGATVATDGVIQAGQDESGLSRTGGGSLDTVSGVSSSSDATQFGPNLKVVTAGQASSSPTNSSQTNADSVSAQTSAGETTSLSGGVSDDPPH